jgi:hypothetical protein
MAQPQSRPLERWDMMQSEYLFEDPREVIQFMRSLDHRNAVRVGELIERVRFFVRHWTAMHPLEPIKGFKVIVSGDDIKVFARACVEIWLSVCSIVTIDVDYYTPVVDEM